MLKLRDYTPADFGELWKLDQLCFTRGIAYTRQELRYFLASKASFAILGELDGKTVGFAVAESQRNGLGHIITIDVHTAARRFKVGTRLMDAVEERLSAMCCSSVLLEVSVDNAPAINFYKRRGYTALKTVPRYYLNSLNALLMGKKLPGAAGNASMGGK